MEHQLNPRQRVYNDFVTAILKQGGPAFHSPGTACVYFDQKTGRRCGIGHLIAPVYRPQIEGHAWDELVDLRGGRSASAHIDSTYGTDSMGVDLTFFNHLQAVHDSAFLRAVNATTLGADADADADADRLFMAKFRESAGQFAEQWNLSAEVLEAERG